MVKCFTYVWRDIDCKIKQISFRTEEELCDWLIGKNLDKFDYIEDDLVPEETLGIVSDVNYIETI